MGCVFISKYNNNTQSQNEILLPPIEKNIRKIKTDSFGNAFALTNNSKMVNNHRERINNFSSLEYAPLKYEIQLKSGRKFNISVYTLNKLISAIKGFLFRKKYDDYLKTKLLDYTNELYFDYIILTKNYNSSKILNSKNNEKIKNILKTSWEEFYIKDPTKLLNDKINKVKKYPNGLVFKYKKKNKHNRKNKYNFDASDLFQSPKTAESCYKGSVDIMTNKKNGYGELITLDGTHKIGTFYNDKFCGWNILVKNNGYIYIGLFNNDVLVGKGLIYNSFNDYMYKGDFKNSMKEGFGEEISEGNIYKGEFEGDKKNGQGEMVLKNKDKYKGMFKNDKFHGEGNYIYYNKNKEYTGNFVDNKMHGNGLLKFGKDKYYKGLFNNGIREGKGEFGFVDGDKFFFNFINDLPYGKGHKQKINSNKDNLTEVFYNQGKIIDENKNEIVFVFE